MHNPSTPYQLWYPNRTLIYFESSSFFLGSPLCRQLYVKFEFEISSDLYLSPCVISTDTVWDRASQNNYSGWWQIRLQFTALKCLVYLLWWSDGQRAKEEILHLSIRREGKWTLFHRWHLETFQPNMTLKHGTCKLFLKLHFKQWKSECSYTINHWDAKLPELWGTCSVLSNHEWKESFPVSSQREKTSGSRRNEVFMLLRRYATLSCERLTTAQTHSQH